MLRVAYMVHRFPYLPETFVVREMLAVQRHGVSVEVFSLMRPKDSAASSDADPLVSRTYYSRAFSPPVLRAQIGFLLHAPGAYLLALADLVRLTWREPRVMGLVLALFPKAVYFATIMRKLGIDHIHANFVWIEAVLANAIRRLIGVTYSIRPHAFGLFSRNSRDVRLQLERADGIVTVSDYHRRFIRALSPQLAQTTVDVVHCGIETGRWVPLDKEDSGTFRIISVGRAVPKKGHRHLVAACALLAERGRDFECLIVAGSGKPVEELERQVVQQGLEGHVSFLPYRDENGLVDLLSTGDVFALACVIAPDGDRDGIPVALMEAMSAGIPVVTTPVAGIPELVVDGETGLLVPTADSEELAAALERLMDDPALRRRLSARARSHVIQHFDEGATGTRLVEIFERHAKSGQRYATSGG